MLQMIPNDFDVGLIFQDDESSLFAAPRSDVWHIVLAATKSVASNHKIIDIGQFHFPRYCVARAILSSDNNASISPDLVRKMGFMVKGESLSFKLLEREYRLPQKLLKDMRKDLQILEKALAKVKSKAIGFEVTDALTTQGHPVVAEQRSLAEAIAFERESRKFLEPGQFGVYSAFCTWRDFLCDDPTKKKFIAIQMAKEMVTWDPHTFGDDVYWQSVFEIQKRLWGARVWGPGLDVEEEILFDAFFGTFERLSSIQFAQFVLLNGMHRGGPFHAFATLFGLIDFEGYKYWRTRDFQPDSIEMQQISTQSSLIELLGVND